MARRARYVMLNYPYHVLVRGTGGQAIFRDDDDRQAYRDILADAIAASGVQLHGYALLSREVHLIMTPRQEGALGQAMQVFGRQYVRRFNARHQRAGTLWEGRFRSSLIQPDPYLLIVQRHIETAPVRAGLVARPEDYPWSSHRHLLGLINDPIVTPHSEYWQLGNTPFEREGEYRRRLEARPDLPDSTLMRLLGAGHPVAGDAFLERHSRAAGFELRPKPVGRPRRSDATGSIPPR